jgi:serine/threonine-protein kinase
MPCATFQRALPALGGSAILASVSEEGDRPAEAQDPTRVAHFRIVGRLGAGGMGVVYRAEDEKLRRTVALKLLPEASRTEERRQRFLREARSAAAITHPNVAVVYQVDEADGRVFIAMELVEGESLRARLERGPLDVGTARELALQMARGLAAAHEKGIVHRDLKPENVMITPAGVVKLLDFGLAKAAGEGARASGKAEAALAKTETVVTSDEGRVMGTPEYMSPEQAMGQPLDVRSDVFSFGSVLYEMLTGVRPFEGSSTGAVLVAIARDHVVPLRERAPEVDAQTADVVARCLAKAPEARFAHAGEVAAALSGPRSPHATTQSQTDVPAVAPGRAARAEGKDTRAANRGIPMIGLAGALLVVALAGAVLAVRRHAVNPANESPSASSPAAPIAAAGAQAAALPYDDGGGPSKNPEAQRLYEQAIAEFHGGTGQAHSFLLKAVELDPGFGAAYLRLLILHQYDWNTRLRETFENEASLSDRDRTLFGTVQGGFADVTPAQARVQEKALDAYLVRYPHDEIAIYSRWGYALEQDGENAGCRYLEKVVGEMPSFLTATAMAAGCLAREPEGKAAAIELIDRCLSVSPHATDCLGVRVDVDETAGDCSSLESDARRLIHLRPDSQDGRDGLAHALAEQGAPAQAIRDLFTPFFGKPGWILAEAVVPMLEGDFVEVEKVGAAALEAAQGKKDTDHMLAPGVALIEAFTEAGDLDAAARAGETLVGTRALCGLGCIGAVAKGLFAMARGALLTRAQANAQLLDLYKNIAGRRGYAWVRIYGAHVLSPEDARIALSAYEGEERGPPDVYTGRALAIAYALAGRRTEARSAFARVGSECSLATDTQPTMAEHLLRGRLDEEDGNKAGACGHYSRILERWGHAKPKSVTADEARARATKLGCSL